MSRNVTKYVVLHGCFPVSCDSKELDIHNTIGKIRATITLLLLVSSCDRVCEVYLIHNISPLSLPCLTFEEMNIFVKNMEIKGFTSI